MARRLGLPQMTQHTSVGSLSTVPLISESMVNAEITSRYNNYSRTLTFLIVPQIAELIPEHLVDRREIIIPSNIKLADPEFHRPAPIDILISAGPALSIFCVGQINLAPEGPDLFLQKTLLGWVIGGSTGHKNTGSRRARGKCHLTTAQEFDLERFWRVEEIPETRGFTMQEAACEEHFQQHTTRDTQGRYIVALPFTEKVTRLGESRLQALRRLKALDRKFSKDPEFKSQYTAVIQEYLDLGHMTVIPNEEAQHTKYYIPHHAVIKDCSLTTKVRVVFDGSARTSSGVSLNETLMIGPTIHTDLLRLLLRFRMHTYVLTADIEKMYRQFMVKEEDRVYQCILWYNSSGEIITLQLNTVTFGLAPSPFLAVRCLHQLANDEGSSFPKAARVLKESTYVDDAHITTNNWKEAISTRDEVIELLQKGCLNIRQWASNDPALLQGIPSENINRQLQLGDSTLKTLGVFWDTTKDVITYTIKTDQSFIKSTKRSILSEIAKIYDPIGLLSPVIIKAKMFLQQIWSLKIDWDESLPASLHTEWVNYYNQLPLLQNMTFQRATVIKNATETQLHGFCDASQKGYGCCLYVRTTDIHGNIESHLLCAKSRVAPLKALTIPRLELCAAQELTNLYLTVKKSLQLEFNKEVLWTDSTIVLHWLRTEAAHLLPFVSNRVSDIQTKTSPHQWRHVRTNHNPADHISRGLFPKELQQVSNWQHGPDWLIQQEDQWPQLQLPAVKEELLEKRKLYCFTTRNIDISLLEKYSDITKLERIIAYVNRFKIFNQNKGPITAEELKEARRTLIRVVQWNAFSKDIENLKHHRSLDNNSHLLPLTPFMDQHGILRVGGRLSNSNIPFDQRHPILLPRTGHITKLYIKEEHHRQLHAGQQATFYALRRRFWIIDGRNAVRHIIRQCVTCVRHHPTTLKYIMGNLPASRVTQSRPFSKVGIDYCGPFFIKEKKFRNRAKIKIYVAVFVCFITKAVHLEIVSDLTSEAFIAALRRFISRRGHCTDIFTDNGTTFVGTSNKLKDLQELLESEELQDKLIKFLTPCNINWHFIPARSPNFGGLWEAAVKSFKHHLKRVASDTLFTFEEFNTLVIEIEAVLNSRPISALSSDPNDMITLTPGHFLIGDSLTALPSDNLLETPTNRLSTYQHIQKVKQDFWARFYKEYITDLAVRHKWTRNQPNLEIGTVVLIKEDNLPPQQWAMGRIINLHPGRDGIVRVVTVKTATNTLTRSVTKLAPLPTQPDEKDDSTAETPPGK